MRTLWFRLGVAVIACSLVLIPLACWQWRIWSLKDYRAFQEVSRYALGQELWSGRITAGVEVEDLIKKEPPHRLRRYGRFVELTYYSGGPPPPMSIPFESLAVIAKDGKLIFAGAAGCTWAHFFFEMTPEESAEWNRAFEQCLAENWKEP
jgi:hypothetical protein